MTTIVVFPLHYINTKHFTLEVTHKKNKTVITMQLLNGIINTRQIPSVIFQLKRLIPNIFTSQCFNDLNIPFLQEAQETEMGHLFEHIMLEYLCEYKADCGEHDVVFSGVTFWNWKKTPRGTFTISIDATAQDRFIFSQALKKAIEVISVILDEQAIHPTINTKHSPNYNVAFTK